MTTRARAKILVLLCYDYETSCCLGKPAGAALLCNGARWFTSRDNPTFSEEFEMRPYSLSPTKKLFDELDVVACLVTSSTLRFLFVSGWKLLLRGVKESSS